MGDFQSKCVVPTLGKIGEKIMERFLEKIINNKYSRIMLLVVQYY